MAEAEKKQIGLKKPVIWVILLVALGGAAFAASRLLNIQAESRRQAESLAALQAAAVAAPPPTAAVAPTSTPMPRLAWLNGYAKKPDKAIDFNALRAINKDIVAWIAVPGTMIDHPIVFAPRGDEFYLEHDFDRNESEHGTPYIDGYNSSDFSDPVTVAYGHTRDDGSMFTSLHNFESGAFFDANRTIRIYIDDYMLEYEIIAAYQTDDTHILHENDFVDADVFTSYVEGVFSQRDLNAKLRPRELSAEDRLITLVTCVNFQDDARYLVQGALMKDE